MKISGAKIIMETLIEQGCDTVFGYPGGQVINIFDELYQYRDKINHVLTAHEQGASHAADGYARATGKVGVVIATSGPGATNLVTGIATAHQHLGTSKRNAVFTFPPNTSAERPRCPRDRCEGQTASPDADGVPKSGKSQKQLPVPAIITV